MKFVYKSNIAAGLALAVLVVAASPLMATAHQGVDHSKEGPGHPETRADSMREAVDDSIRYKAAELLQEKRQNRQAQSEAQRQEVCKQHKDAIDERFKTLGNASGRHLNGFNTIFTKLQAYQAKKQLNVANYDALVADTAARQETATVAVAALSAQSGARIDCSATDPATSVATVKTATKNARDALQAYRASLKMLAKALLDAKSANGANTTGDTRELKRD